MADQEMLNVLGKLITAIVKMADSDDPFVKVASECLLVDTVGHLASAIKQLQELKPQPSQLTPERIAEMGALASEFEKTGDPVLMKQAELIDEILLTIGTPQGAFATAKQAQDIEVSRIKERNKRDDDKSRNPYTMVKAELDKQNNVEETRKMIAEKVKDYRPMEAPLNTRSCPDHPGAQMSRVAEHVFQCALDKAIYNYETGYTTMKGNKVPGGDVANQTQALFDRPNEFTSFDTRESKLNQP